MEQCDIQTRRSSRSTRQYLNYSVLAQSGRVVLKPLLQNLSAVAVHAKMSHDKHFATIEGDIGGLKTQVTDIGSKLDKLLETLVIQSDKEVNHSRNSNNGLAGANGGQDKQPDAVTQSDTQHHTGANGYSESVDDFVSRNIDRDKFQHYHNGNPGSYIENPISRGMQKPYMYISREGLYTNKQKLDVCNSISAIEYIDATLSAGR